MSRIKSKRFVFSNIALATALLMGCGSGDSSDNAEGSRQSNEVASIVLNAPVRLLTEQNQVTQISAEIFNAFDEPLEKTLTWTSSEPAHFSVDDSGRVTSHVTNGHAFIFAEVDDVQSNRISVSTATPVASSIVLQPQHIVTPPSKSVLASSLGSIAVELVEDLSIQIDDVIINTGTPFFAGKVSQIELINNVQHVTFTRTALDETFSDYAIEVNNDLNLSADNVREEILELYDVTELENGGFRFTLKSTPLAGMRLQSSRSARQIASQTQAADALFNTIYSLGPFQCRAAANISAEPVSFSVLPEDFTINGDPSLIIAYDSQTVGLEKVTIDGTYEVGVVLTNDILAKFEGIVDCEAEIFVIEPELPGTMVDIIPVDIPISVGLRIDASMQTVAAKTVSRGNVIVDAEFGISCIENFDEGCQPYSSSTTDTYFDFDYTLSNIDDIENDSQATIRTMPYVSTAVRLYGYNLFSYLAGLAHNQKMGGVASQIKNDHLFSEYSISAETGLTAGQNHSAVWELIEQSSNATDVRDLVEAITNVDFSSRDDLSIETNSTFISRSPSAVQSTLLKQLVPVSAYQRSNFLSGENPFIYTENALQFDLSIVPTSENFWLPNQDGNGFSEGYNIKDVVVYRVEDQSNPSDSLQEFTRTTAQTGQLDFSISFSGNNLESDTGQYFAFATTEAGASMTTSDGEVLDHDYKLGELISPAFELEFTQNNYSDFIDYVSVNSSVLVKRYDDSGELIPAENIKVSYGSYKPDLPGVEVITQTTDSNGRVNIQYNVRTNEYINEPGMDVQIFVMVDGDSYSSDIIGNILREPPSGSCPVGECCDIYTCPL